MPDYPHHVTQRGARKQTVFFRRSDYELYRTILAETKDRMGVSIWAYCLMPNHVHLIVVPRERRCLARLFHSAHSKYARRINAREGWQGHLWQERYHSFVMDETHLLAAVRYVELNPVRARLCRDPAEWPWSSFHAHCAGSDDELVNVKPMLDRIVDWRRFLSCQESDNQLNTIRSHSRSGRPAGNPAFLGYVKRLRSR